MVGEGHKAKRAKRNFLSPSPPLDKVWIPEWSRLSSSLFASKGNQDRKKENTKFHFVREKIKAPNDSIAYY